VPNGAPGDHPITDILNHGIAVYSPSVDELIRQIVALGGRRLIENKLFGEFSPYQDPDVPRLEAELTSLRDKLLAEAKDREWEV